LQIDFELVNLLFAEPVCHCSKSALLTSFGR